MGRFGMTTVGSVFAGRRVVAWPLLRGVKMVVSVASVSLALALPSPAAAVTYVNTAAAGINNIGLKVTNVPASYSVFDLGASASSSTSNDNGGTVTARGDSDGNKSSAGSARIIYTFTIVGASDVYVPVRVQARGWVAGGGEFNSNALLRLDSLGSNGIFRDITAGPPRTGYDDYDEFFVDEVVNLFSNADNTVDMAATISAGYSPNYSGWAEAFVDPIFTIDAAYADRFTLVGIPQAAAGVPEPATWAFMILGFGAIGGAMRRRRTGTSAAQMA